MKTDKLVALLQATQGVKTVKVKFSNGGSSYTYKTLENLKTDDWVVVEARGAYSTAKVIEMDSTPDINPDVDFELAWVVCKVDTTKIEAIREEEKILARQIAMTEAKKRIENVLKETGLDLSDIKMPALLGNG
jgi:hypothetical protein